MQRFLTPCLMVCLLMTGLSAPLLASDSIDVETRQALLQALEDERHAAATYEAVIARHGEILPFANIVQAEHRHIGHLLDFFGEYELRIPDDPWAGKAVETPATVADACRQAIEAEKRNIALYDEILPAVQKPEIREMFSHLQEISRDRHLPAFERCSGRVVDATTAGCCGGCGKRGAKRARGAGPRWRSGCGN